MKCQKGFSSTIIIAIVAILIAISVFVAVKKGTNLNVYNKGGSQQATQTQQPAISAIQNSNDLNAAAADLDNTDIDGIDSELNQIEADAFTF